MTGNIILGIEIIVGMVYAIYAVFSHQPHAKEWVFAWMIALIIIMIDLLIYHS